MKPSPECRRCRHFEPGNPFMEIELGYCHRFPPVGKFNGVKPSFASTRGDEWCGEFQPDEGDE